jgi:DNA-binding PadR family transcriptional regulator
MTPPVFAHGHLRLYLLSLLSESEAGMHGYELIQSLGERFGGTYVPSAGTIYPRLGKLEEEGLVTKTADGRKTIYSITAAGRAELEARRGELDDIEAGVDDSVRRLADQVRTSVDDAMRTLKAELAAAAREARVEIRSDGRPGAEPPSEPTRSRSGSRQRLQEAELAVHEFRSGIRTDLRRRVADGELDEQTVRVLREGLTELRRAVRESLG